jgi:hypothetical protein
MCSRTEWDCFVRRFEDAVEEGQLRNFASDAVARIDALIDEISAWACPPENAERFRGRRRRSQPEWVV